MLKLKMLFISPPLQLQLNLIKPKLSYIEVNKPTPSFYRVDAK